MLGDILRQEREKQGLTVKDIERETSIRTLYISSIEEGNYDVLPGEVYLKGFIKTYANFLKLDGTEMVKLYREEKGEDQAEAALPVEEVQKPVVQESAQRTEPAQVVPSTENSSTAIKLSAIAIAVLVIGGLGYWMLSAEDDAKPPAAPAPIAQQAPKVAPDEKRETPAPVKPKQEKPVELVAKFSDNCWTQVTADGKVIFEGTPKNGETISWKADRDVVLHVGNAGAIEVQYNGKAVGKLGNTGDVVVKTFTKDKVS